MPLYEYECVDNGHRFEVIQKFSDPPVEICPKCGSPVRKVISSPAIQFKGTGWYITDYARKDSGGTKASGETTDKGEKDKGEKGKGESKESPKTDAPKSEPTSSESKPST